MRAERGAVAVWMLVACGRGSEVQRTFAKMSGANIRNAALSAAFLAAADGADAIHQAHLVRAARAEYRSMGHVLADRGRAP